MLQEMGLVIHMISMELRITCPMGLPVTMGIMCQSPNQSQIQSQSLSLSLNQSQSQSQSQNQSQSQSQSQNSPNLIELVAQARARRSAERR